MNCLKAGHMASKCRANPACRTCYKALHTLLHVDISKLPEESKTERIHIITHVHQHKKETGPLDDMSREDHWN